MTVPFEVEEIREHYYLVRAEAGGEPAETRFHIEREVLDAWGLGSASSDAVVRATVAYLLARQGLDDLPTQVDLEDVAAVYESFPEQLRASIEAGGS